MPEEDDQCVDFFHADICQTFKIKISSLPTLEKFIQMSNYSKYHLLKGLNHAPPGRSGRIQNKTDNELVLSQEWELIELYKHYLVVR